MRDESDGLEALSLWVIPSEEKKKQWILTLFRFGTTLNLRAHTLSDLTKVELDSLVAEVRNELEEQVGWVPCELDPARGDTCVRPAEPRLLYLMAPNHLSGEPPVMVIYNLAARHGARALVINLRENEPTTGRWVEGEIFEALFNPDYRTFRRGEFPLQLTNGPSGNHLALSVFDRGGMPPDALDALVQDAKATLEAHYGERFCRANPDTKRCDAEHADLEREREAWLRVRATHDTSAIETFFKERPDGRYAEAARERAAQLRGLAKHPPLAPSGTTARWVGRRPGEQFADALSDGLSGPRMMVVPAGVFRMGCSEKRGCPLEELPVHEVRVGYPFALSTREVTHAEYYRFAQPEKRLDASWSDRPATIAVPLT